MGTTNAADELIGIARVKKATGYHEVSIWRKVRAGDFPKPIYFGTRRRWRLADVLAWVEAQASRPREVKLQGCVAQLVAPASP